ncbi:MAG: hypothetical protein J2P57_23470 [Acidimicrobiaceae bacterium]|nr:hypothetical protein [Acidimicrobiaceae bacterium]
MDSLRELWEVGGRQYGLLSSAQFRSATTAAGRRRLIARGVVEPYIRGVWVLAGTPPRWRQQALAACLAYGPPVAVSGLAAARLWELDGVTGGVDVEVSIPHARSGRHPGVTARRRTLSAFEITERFGIPVTTMPRTLLDVASSQPAARVAGWFDDAIVRGLVTVDTVERYLRDVVGRSRPGQDLVRELVDARLGEDAMSESVGELRVHRWLVQAGLPPPVRQFRVAVGGVARRLDMAYPDLLIAIEFQGFRHHGRARARFDADQRRITELTLAGWLVVLVTSAMSEHEVVTMVRRARAARGAA